MFAIKINGLFIKDFRILFYNSRHNTTFKRPFLGRIQFKLHHIDTALARLSMQYFITG